MSPIEAAFFLFLLMIVSWINLIIFSARAGQINRFLDNYFSVFNRRASLRISTVS